MDAQSPLTTPAPVVLTGALDQYSADSLKQQLLDVLASAAPGSPPNLTFDMSTVEHIDASALQVLLACRAALPGEKLLVHGADSSVRQWIQIAGAGDLFEFSGGID